MRRGHRGWMWRRQSRVPLLSAWCGCGFWPHAPQHRWHRGLQAKTPHRLSAAYQWPALSKITHAHTWLGCWCPHITSVSFENKRLSCCTTVSIVSIYSVWLSPFPFNWVQKNIHLHCSDQFRVFNLLTFAEAMETPFRPKPVRVTGKCTLDPKLAQPERGSSQTTLGRGALRL